MITPPQSFVMQYNYEMGRSLILSQGLVGILTVRNVSFITSLCHARSLILISHARAFKTYLSEYWDYASLILMMYFIEQSAEKLKVRKVEFMWNDMMENVKLMRCPLADSLNLESFLPKFSPPIWLRIWLWLCSLSQ